MTESVTHKNTAIIPKTVISENIDVIHLLIKDKIEWTVWKNALENKMQNL